MLQSLHSSVCLYGLSYALYELYCSTDSIHEPFFANLENMVSTFEKQVGIARYAHDRIELNTLDTIILKHDNYR
jgi:hypothetical protein